MAPFDKSHTSSYLHSIVIMALYGVISDIKRDIGRKSRFLHTPPVSISRRRMRYAVFRRGPPLGVVPSEYCHNVWYGK